MSTKIKAEQDADFVREVETAYNLEENTYFNAVEMLYDGSKSLDTSGEIRYKKGTKIWIDDKQEYAKLAHILAIKNGNKPRKIEYAYTDNYFYIVKDNKIDNFTPIIQLNIESNRELINDITRELENGTFQDTETLAYWVKPVQSREGSNDRNYDYASRRRSNGRTNALYGEQSGNDTGRNLRESGGDRNGRYSIKDVTDVPNTDYARYEGDEYVGISEVTATVMEKLLSDERYIKRLCQDNRTLGKRILNKIHNMWERLKGESKEEKELRAVLKQAEKLYNAAIAHAPERGKIKYVNAYIEQDIDNGEKVDNNDKISYSFKKGKVARYITHKIDVPTLSYIRNQLNKIYGTVENAVADGIAVEYGNIIYVVDSGIEDGHIDFGVRKKLSISDNDLRKTFIRRKNDEAIRKGYISDELSSNFGAEYANSWDGYRRQQSGKKLSIVARKSQNSQSGISGKDAIGRRGLKLIEEKDSQGRSITSSQAEYFKDSKVRDNNGNLLVLYRSADGGRTMRKKAIKKEASQHGENANALSFTPNATVDTASTNSIRNKSEIVNPSEQKIFALFYVTKKAKGERAKP